MHGTNRGTPIASRPDVDRVEAVDVLQRVDPLDDRPLVDLRRQGKLDEDAVDRRVGVEPVDRRRAARPGWSSAGSRSDVAVHPGGLAGVLLVADVDLAGRVVADEDDGQAGHDPRHLAEPSHLARRLLPQRPGQCFSVKKDRWHGGFPGSQN